MAATPSAGPAPALRSTPADLPDPAAARAARGGRPGHRRLRLPRFALLSLRPREHRLPAASRARSTTSTSPPRSGSSRPSVALLMIAGEFDLSVGSLVGFAGIMIGIGVDDLGPADLAGDPHLDGR